MKKKIWVFAEYVNCALDRVTLELLTKAKELAAAIPGETEIGAVLLGCNVKSSCETLANYGAEKIYLAEAEEMGLYNPMLYAPIITKLVKQEDPEIFLFGATAIGSELGPTVAAQLKTGVAAHCVDLRINEKEQLVANVPSFGGKILGEILCPDTRPQMASVKPGIFVQGEAEQREPDIIEVDVSGIKADDLPLKAVSLSKKEIEGVPLDKAEVVFCGGYGLGNKENWEKLEKLAAMLGGAAACTRPVVDEGWAPGEHVMVGTSGKSIRPKAYVGFGISGATHHICGMKDSGLVISVNRDEKAAVFEVSDAGAAADLNKIL
ncbi:MAG TPA: electron transfer flavoprotein subunit alpha/FixB family protein, partial [Clostridia bacterium]|nr:electron transfer flavoprotein subunit alpha/FixB family protein [Clostridia bacterium]